MFWVHIQIHVYDLRFFISEYLLEQIFDILPDDEESSKWILGVSYLLGLRARNWLACRAACATVRRPVGDAGPTEVGERIGDLERIGERMGEAGPAADGGGMGDLERIEERMGGNHI